MFDFAPLTLEDIPFLLEVRNECRDFLHDNRMFTLDDCRVWFREKHPDFQVDASIYVGADLHRSYRGRGLARLAYEAFLPLLKNQYHVSTVKLEVLSHNTVALRLYQKLGFVEIDRKKGFAVREDRLVDSIVMMMSL